MKQMSDHPDSDPMRRRRSRFIYGPNDEVERLSLEIAKLRAELDAFERPPHKNPSFIVPALTTLVALLGIVVQWSLSKAEYINSQTQSTLTQIEREHTKAEVEELQNQRATITSAVATLNQEYTRLVARRDTGAQQLALIDRALARAQDTTLGRGASSGKLDLEAATVLVQEARREQSSRTQEIRRGFQQVEEVRAELRFLNSPAAVAVVIGGFGNIDQARRDAASARSKGFPASVFHRNNMFRTAVWFTDQGSARSQVPSIRERIRRSAYMVNWRDWCPGVNARSEYYECRPSAPERVID